MKSDRTCLLGVSRTGWVGAVLLVLICLLAFALRYDLRYQHGYLFYGNAVTGIPESDANTWSIHALNLVGGRRFGDYLKQFRCHNYVPPGHPFFLGALYYYIGQNHLAVGWAVALLSCLLPLLAYLLTREMWGRGPGWIAAFLAAVHTPFVGASFSLMSEATAFLVTAVALWMWARLLRVRRLTWAAAAGLVLGFSALVRPTTFACATAMTPWLLYAPGVPWRRRVVLPLVFLVSFLVLPAAWQVRNRVVHGRVAILYSSISARHAWTGANPEYRPSYYSRRAWHDTLWRDPDATELDRVQRLQRETREFVRPDRLRYLLGCVWRMRLLRWKNETERLDIRWTYGGRSFALTSLLFLFGALGALRALRTRRVVECDETERTIPGYIWTCSFGASLLLMVAGAGVYGAAGRYRWPLEYFLIPFAALTLCGLFNMGKVDLVGLWVFRETISPAWHRLRRTGGLVIAATVVILTVVYGVGLMRARWLARHPTGHEPTVSMVDVQAALAANGLAAELASQTPNWLSYEAVFREQAAHYGKVTSCNGQLVVWWGRVLYPRFFDDGSFEKGYLILAPAPGDFGGARLGMTPAPGAAKRLSELKEGAVVTVIGRIHYIDDYMKRADLRIHAVLPGQLDPASGSPGRW